MAIWHHRSRTDASIILLYERNHRTFESLENRHRVHLFVATLRGSFSLLETPRNFYTVPWTIYILEYIFGITSPWESPVGEEVTACDYDTRLVDTRISPSEIHVSSISHLETIVFPLPLDSFRPVFDEAKWVCFFYARSRERARTTMAWERTTPVVG